MPFVFRGFLMSSSNPQRRNTLVDEFDSPDVFDKLSRPILPDDPVYIVAEILLKRAVDAAATTLEDAARDGAVCIVVVPGPWWAEPVRHAWMTSARQGIKYVDGVTLDDFLEASWVAWAPQEKLTDAESRNAEAAFSMALGSGLHIAAFSEDARWLPPVFVPCMDRQLIVPPMTGSDIDVMVSKMCGETLKHLLAARVRAMLNSAYTTALALMKLRKLAVVAVAKALLETRALDGVQVNRLVDLHPGQSDAESGL
jgi:hypothetical protein